MTRISLLSIDNLLQNRLGTQSLRTGLKRAFRLIRILNLYTLRHQQRRQLRALSDQQLADIGLTREQALKEARKGFWH